MSVIFILIGCSLLLASSFLIAFLWASKEGQFEDDYTPSIRILFEDGSANQGIHLEDISSSKNEELSSKTNKKFKHKT